MPGQVTVGGLLQPNCNDVTEHSTCLATIINYKNSKKCLLPFLLFIKETDKT